MPGQSRWVFEQLAGRRRTLELADHAAPHGRPRQDAVVEDAVEVRETETYYSGDVPPTRHLFGVKFPPWDLKGRFSDGYGGLGFAKAKTEEVRAFVAEQQPVRITWGDVVSVMGLIKTFTPGREAWGEVPWTMHVLIDTDHFLAFPAPVEEPQRPAVDYAKVWEALNPEALPETPQLRGGVLDALNGLISIMNEFSAATLQIADQIDQLATAPFALVARFRAGLHQVATAAIRLRNTYTQLRSNAAIEGERSQNLQSFMGLQAKWDRDFLQGMERLFELDRQAELAQAGQVRGQVVAVAGDTWESLSRRVYGDGTRAEDIRAINGAEAGQQPQAGVAYLVPT